MNYSEMIEGLRRAGHDVSGYVQKGTAPVRNDLITLDVNEIASVIDQSIALQVDPLARRVAELERECKALRALVSPQVEAKLAALQQKLDAVLGPRAFVA